MSTISELKEFSRLSQRTIERRLKQWKTYRSYNHNGCYYVLPQTPEFGIDGLWKYKGIRFSIHGGLISSIISNVEKSLCGLSAKDLEKLFGCSVAQSLLYLKEKSKLLREKDGGVYFYFSVKTLVYSSQRQKRIELRQSHVKGHLPSDVNSVAILVELIKHPADTLDQLTRRVRRRGISVSIDEVKNLLIHHDLEKKRLLYAFSIKPTYRPANDSSTTRKII